MCRGRQAVSCSSIVQVNTRGHYFSRRRFIVICQRDFVFPRTTTNQPTIPRWVLIMFVLLYIDCQFHRHKVHKVQSASEGGQVLNLRNNRSPMTCDNKSDESWVNNVLWMDGVVCLQPRTDEWRLGMIWQEISSTHGWTDCSFAQFTGHDKVILSRTTEL